MTSYLWPILWLLASQVAGPRIPPPGTNLTGQEPAGSPTLAIPQANTPQTAPQYSPGSPTLAPAARFNTPAAVPLQPTPLQGAPASPIPTTIPNAAAPQSIALTSNEQTAPIVPVETRNPKAEAALLVDAWLTTPEDLKLAGRPTPLIELLASVPDRQQQLLITRAYWQVTAAMIELRLAHDDIRRLEQMQPSFTAQAQARGQIAGALEWQSRVAAARARQTEAELSLLTAQYALVERSGWPRERELPLPSDRPHSGSYRTLLEQLYGTTNVPLSARLFDRQVPYYRDAIQAQAGAVHAAYDAADGAIETFVRGQSSLAVLWSAFDDLSTSQRGLVRLVQDFNNDIASYALAIPRNGISPQDLVGMLIQPTKSAVANNEPANAAAPSTIVRPTMINDDQVAPATFLQPNNQPRQGIPGVNEPTLAPPRDLRPAAPGLQQVQRPDLTGGPEGGLYRALIEQTPATRTQELASLLHWDHALPEDLGTGLTLTRALETVPPENRLAAVAAYWQSREMLARYHIAVERVTQLDALQPHLAARATVPGMAEAMLQLRAARMLAKSDLVSARVQLSSAQAKLMQAIGRPTETQWLFASTAPHGGRYQTRLDQVANSPSAVQLNRFGESLGALHRALEERGAAVVMTDAARAEETNQFLANAGSVLLPLDAIERQSQESGAFLDVLTRYNREIAAYALTVLPAGTRSDALVKSLVIEDGAPQK